MGNYIKSSLSIRQFYSAQLNIEQFKSNDWNDGGKCPFHSDKRAGSFRVNVQHGGFVCLSCGKKGGDVVDFLGSLYGYDYKQAIAYLSESDLSQPEKKSIQPPPEPDSDAIRQKLKAEWEQAEPANPNHAYLVKKRIEPNGIRQIGQNIVIPAYNANKSLEAIQNINPKGEKWFSKGSRKKGSYFLLVGDPQRLIICEGFATGCTLAEQTGYTVAIAFDAGNLEPVAVAIKDSLPEVEIIIAADNDRFHKDGTPRTDNPGLAAATKAAQRINARLAVPDFPNGVMGSDFNDLANLEVVQ